jgi:hypothetical protein
MRPRACLVGSTGCPTPRARNAHPVRRRPTQMVTVTPMLRDGPASIVRSAPTRGLLGFSLRRPAEPVLVGSIPPALLGHSRPADQRLRHDADAARARAYHGRVGHPARRAVHRPHGRLQLACSRAQPRSFPGLNGAPCLRTALSVCAQRRLLSAPNAALRLRPTVPSVWSQRRSPLSLCLCPKTCSVAPTPVHCLRPTALFAFTIPRSLPALNIAAYLQPVALSTCTQRYSPCASPNSALRIRSVVLSTFAQWFSLLAPLQCATTTSYRLPLRPPPPPPWPTVCGAYHNDGEGLGTCPACPSVLHRVNSIAF